jgi:Tol biopolymer transport system component
LEQTEVTGYLVLEYVSGQTLSERIAEGKLELDEVLSIALQIAEAMAAAHECGIIHRDLKPGNIKITPDDKVKVLDFGIAKPVKAEVSNEASTVTQPGRIIGTPTYMSPEQARGKSADKRSDIWSFGCVLYEMLTGKVAFEGETVSDTLANVLQTEPDWSELPQNTPANIRVLLRRCLEKDPRRRLRDIGDAAIEISETQTGIAATFALSGEAAARPRLFRRDVILAGLTCLAVGVLVTLALLKSGTRIIPSSAPVVSRLSISLPAEKRIFFGESNPNCYMAISPDGKRIVYVGGADRQNIQLYTRLLDDLQIKPIPGTKGARNPFFSPDGQWVGFFTTQGQLKKVSLAGGEPVTLLDELQWSSVLFGSWGQDNHIIFDGNLGLRRILADGGDPKIIVTSDAEKGHIWPRFPYYLPGGKAIIYTLGSWTEVIRLDSNQRKILLENAIWAQYVASGHLLFLRNQSLMAAPFDIERLEVTGPAIPVVENIRRDASRFVPQMTISDTGTLAYAVASSELDKATLVWVDRQGQIEILDETPRDYRFNRLRLSPDGRQIATQVTVEGAKPQVYLFDIARHMLVQFTTEGMNTNPEWSPDGKRIAFLSERDGGSGLYCKYVDGSGPAKLLTSGSCFPCSWSYDGKFLACMSQNPGTVDDIWILSLDSDSEPQPFLNTKSWEDNPRFSPDGRWIAYASSESGQYEVYVRQYPEGGRKIRISGEGGACPVWAPDGSELFYSDGTEMMAAAVTYEPDFSVGKPQPLFDITNFSVGGNFGPGYDVTPDGRRFVILKRSEKPEVELVVVQNWFEELKRLAPLETDK